MMFSGWCERELIASCSHLLKTLQYEDLEKNKWIKAVIDYK